MATSEELQQMVADKKREQQQLQSSAQLAQGILDQRKSPGEGQEYHPSQEMISITVPRSVAVQLARQQAIEEETLSYKAYQLPSAPCTYHYADGSNDICPDGVLRTKDEDRIAELDHAVRVGNITVLDPKHPKFRRQIPPQAITKEEVATQEELAAAAKVALKGTSSGLSMNQLIPNAPENQQVQQ